jgi:hypothetical protein
MSRAPSGARLLDHRCDGLVLGDRFADKKLLLAAAALPRTGPARATLMNVFLRMVRLV